MAIYAISDLHLALSVDKPMDIFGHIWENCVERLWENWQKTVKSTDVVIMPGDISWATYIHNADADFAFIDRLNGQKLILKGNHDYWWTTLRKMNQYLEKKAFHSIRFIHNNAFLIGTTAICGTRGWTLPHASSTQEDIRFFEREKQRLVLSLEDARRQKAETIIAALHYPPVEQNGGNTGFLEIMQQYGVAKCVYGHLHGAGHRQAVNGTAGGIEMQLVSCDYLNFTPILLQSDT